MNAQIRHKDLVSRSARLAFERVVAATPRAAAPWAQLARAPPAARARRPGGARARRDRRAGRDRRRRADRPGGAAPPPRLADPLSRRRAARVRGLRADGARHRQGRQRADAQFRPLAADRDRRLRRLRGDAHERRLRGRLLGPPQRGRGPRRRGRPRARPRRARVRGARAGGARLGDRDPGQRRGRAADADAALAARDPGRARRDLADLAQARGAVLEGARRRPRPPGVRARGRGPLDPALDVRRAAARARARPARARRPTGPATSPASGAPCSSSATRSCRFRR